MLTDRGGRLFAGRLAIEFVETDDETFAGLITLGRTG
jgi:hypothetical protein